MKTALVRKTHMATLSTRPVGTTSSVYPGAADLAEGFLLATEIGSTGGTEVETNTEFTSEGSFSQKKITYDSMDLRQLAQKLVNSAYNILRKHCAPAFSGMYFVAENDFEELDADLQGLRDAAHEANQIASEHRSNRKTKVEIFPMQVDRANPRIALRMGKAIYEYLSRLRETFESDDKNAYIAEMRMCKNLNKVLYGVQEATVREALRSADDQRPIMIAIAGGRRGVFQVMRDNGGRLPQLDYGPIDRAIALFAPASDAFE